MPSSAVGPFILFLSILLATAHLLGCLFAKLRQPRVIGEILAGVLLGPFVLGRWPAYTHILQLDVATEPKKAGLDLLSWLGLLLLMFLSGAETKTLFQTNERKQIAWLAALGTGLPFAAMALTARAVPLGWFMGERGSRAALVLVMSIAVAVTSIPVISRIFFDLKILHTRFARLVLGVAVLEDIVLWAVLAVAAAIAAAASLPHGKIALHIAATFIYFALGLSIAPRIMKQISKSGLNPLVKNSSVSYTLFMVFAYVAAAGLLDVNMVFAAFLAGFISLSIETQKLQPLPRELISRQRLLQQSESYLHVARAFPHAAKIVRRPPSRSKMLFPCDVETTLIFRSMDVFSF